MINQQDTPSFLPPRTPEITITPKRPGSRKTLDADKLKAEKIKASIRSKVEHPFRYIKQVFGYNKVRYRGLAKNTNRLYLLAAFSNLLIGEKYMLA